VRTELPGARSGTLGAGAAGERIGKYEIVRVIARGGTAVVYEALDPDLGRRVALKVLRDGTSDRLRLEATAAARLHHPNIVSVHEVGPDYIVMDYISGRTLAAAMPQLPLEQRVQLIATVARAVDHAHCQGVVHRDLKPGNILIQTDGRVVLTDFGLAKLSDGDDLTVTGGIMGTPQYMAPEQVRGKGFGTPVDVWALGVLLYLATSDRHPFDSESILDIYDQIVRRDPPTLRGPLGAICARAMEKEPRRRYPHAAALADDLDRYLRGEAVSVSRIWPRLRLRRRLPVAAGLLAALTLSAGLYLQHRAAVRAARESVLSPAEARLAKYKIGEDAATAALERDPGSIKHLIARSQSRQARADYGRDHGRNPLSDYAKAEEDARRAIAVDPQSSEAWLQLSRVKTQRGVYKARYGLDPLEEFASAEADLNQANLAPLESRRWRGNLRFQRGMHLLRTGAVGDGRKDLEEAEASYSPAGDPDAQMRRGWTRAALGKFELADRDFAMALDTKPRHAWAWTRRGEARLQAGDLDGAHRYLSESIRIDPTRADSWEQRGHVRFARRAFADALSDYKQAILLNPAIAPLLAEKLREAELGGRRP
jgi:tetratricopeptide (TPR) repeat protein/predicted Ser/Thr protein kinase